MTGQRPAADCGRCPKIHFRLSAPQKAATVIPTLRGEYFRRLASTTDIATEGFWQNDRQPFAHKMTFAAKPFSLSPSDGERAGVRGRGGINGRSISSVKVKAISTSRTLLIRSSRHPFAHKTTAAVKPFSLSWGR